jgi:hypothetical protein
VANGRTLHPRLVEGEVRVIGDRWSLRVHEIKAFLSRSRASYRWLDVEVDEEAGARWPPWWVPTLSSPPTFGPSRPASRPSDSGPKSWSPTEPLP